MYTSPEMSEYACKTATAGKRTPPHLPGKKAVESEKKKTHTHGVASYRKQLLSHSFAMATAAAAPPNGIGSDSSQTIQMIVSRTFAHSAFVPPGPVGPVPTQRPTDRSDVLHHYHSSSTILNL